MKKHIIKVIMYISIIVIIVFMNIYGHRIWRHVHWKWGYQSKVREELEPIKKELQELRERIVALEKKSG